MRGLSHYWLALGPLILASCADRAPAPAPGPASGTGAHPLTAGETLARIAPGGDAVAVLRSGPQVPIRLPSGFTLYPGARVVSNTVVEHGGQRRDLLVSETPDAVAKVMKFYHAQAEGARARVLLDLGGKGRASLGVRLPAGHEIVVSARRVGQGTRIELAAG